MTKASRFSGYALFALCIAAWPGAVQAKSWAICEASDNLFASGSRHFVLRTGVFETDMDEFALRDEWWGKVHEVSRESEAKKGFGYMGGDCDLYDSEETAQTVLRNQNASDARRSRTVVPVDFAPTAQPKNLVSEEKRIRVPWVQGQLGRPGYQSADIALTYRFLSCADEIVMAYAIDPKSVEVGPLYWGTGASRSIPTDAAEAPAPSAVTLNGMVKVRTDRLHLNPGGTPWAKKVYDEFAGDALGSGCLTGQTQSMGKTADLVGPRAKPEQIKAFLDALVLTEARVGDGPLQNAALDPRAKDADPARARADREAAEAERLAKERAEAEDLARRWAEHEARSKEIFAKAEAERAAHAAAQAKYERELAAKKAADEKYARDLAKFEEETRRVEAARAEYERQMKAYNEAIANGAKPAKPK